MMINKRIHGRDNQKVYVSPSIELNQFISENCIMATSSLIFNTKDSIEDYEIKNVDNDFWM
jgi:hypothetical protein